MAGVEDCPAEGTSSESSDKKNDTNVYFQIYAEDEVEKIKRSFVVFEGSLHQWKHFVQSVLTVIAEKYHALRFQIGAGVTQEEKIAVSGRNLTDFIVFNEMLIETTVLEKPPGYEVEVWNDQTFRRIMNLATLAMKHLREDALATNLITKFRETYLEWRRFTMRDRTTLREITGILRVRMKLRGRESGKER